MAIQNSREVEKQLLAQKDATLKIVFGSGSSRARNLRRIFKGILEEKKEVGRTAEECRVRRIATMLALQGMAPFQKHVMRLEKIRRKPIEAFNAKIRRKYKGLKLRRCWHCRKLFKAAGRPAFMTDKIRGKKGWTYPVVIRVKSVRCPYCRSENEIGARFLRPAREKVIYS